MSDLRDPAISITYAEAFARWGVGTVELHRSGQLKVPVHQEWQRTATTSPEAIRTRIERQGGQYGLKVREGSRAVGLDIDQPEAFPWQSLPKDAVIVRHGSLNGGAPTKAHAWVRLPAGYPADTLPAKRPWGEVANAKQRQLVGPGSLHEDGTLYRVTSGELPEELPELEPRAALELLGTTGPRHDRPPPDAGDWQWSPDMGSRHELLVSRVRKWRGDGLGREALRQNLDDYIERHAIPLTLDGRTITSKELDDMVAWAFEEVSEDEPPARPVTDELIVTERLGIVTATLGGRELRLRRMAGARVQIEAYIDGEPAVMVGSHDLGTVSGNRRLATDLSYSDDDGIGSLRSWLRLVVAAHLHLERSKPALVTTGLYLTEEEQTGRAMRLHPQITQGDTTIDFGHRSRMKTQLAVAKGLSMLSGAEVVPGMVPVETIDGYVIIEYETTASKIKRIARGLCETAGIDWQDVSPRFHIVAGGVPDLTRLPDVVLPLLQPGKRYHVDLDSMERAIVASSRIVSGMPDAWGAGAGLVFRFFDELRGIGDVPDLSATVLDHPKGNPTGHTDDLDAMRGFTIYGSSQKDRIARAVYGVARTAYDPVSGRSEQRIWTIKDPDDGPSPPDLYLFYDWDPDTGHLSITRSGDQLTRRGYPLGVHPGSVAAGLCDLYAELATVKEDDGVVVIDYPTVAFAELQERTGAPKGTLSSVLTRHSGVFRSPSRGVWTRR